MGWIVLSIVLISDELNMSSSIISLYLIYSTGSRSGCRLSEIIITALTEPWMWVASDDTRPMGTRTRLPARRSQSPG